MEAQSKHKDINHAFLAAQRNMSNAKKGSDNPYFKSKYADLNSIREAVIPALLSEDIMITQPEVIIEGRNYVRTILTHAPTGTTIQCDVEILIKNSNDPQAQGSAITYARRYGLQSLCAIGAEDDDGNRAAGRSDKPTPQSTINLKEALFEIKNCEDLEQLKQTWLRHKELQKNNEFLNAKEQRKNELATAN